ncbi:hypothetical protein LAZ67_15003090 [Cordylochernes scorpioides]|uniref:Integrase p58-like C-terminal domain-containing protein n=1 Tax=Cordylochernes scorpioides TaxID=51811 RepID=A0ABY6LA07_9ARAC|nr:hypothetical protein LAZ67_15003090 [Cordylochernes scorpioides]
MDYNVGDLVWIFIPIRKVGLSEKLMKRYFGPYRVNRKLSDVTFEVEPVDQPTRRRQTRDLVHVLRMKPYLDPEDQADLFKLLTKLKNYDAHVPNIYGAPKVHKPNCPLRPIHKQLKIYQYFNENEIVNSYEFKEDIIDMKLNGNQRIISLDVESMFTSIPIPTIMDALNHVIKESKINNLPKSEFLIE